MKIIFYLASLIALVSAEWTCQNCQEDSSDWTCKRCQKASTEWTTQSCQEASQLGAESTLSDDVIEYVWFCFKSFGEFNWGSNCRGELYLFLQYTVCPAFPNSENCKAFLPSFWRAIAREVKPVVWSHICDDITVTETGASRPSCNECKERVTTMMGYLRNSDIQDWWLETLQAGSFCRDNYSGLETVCSGYLDSLLKNLLESSTSINFWINGWCNNTFGCV